MLTQSGLLVLLAKATIILVAALGMTRVMQRASAGARHLVWLVTLGVLLVVPASTMWAPLRVRVLPPVSAVRLPALYDVRTATATATVQTVTLQTITPAPPPAPAPVARPAVPVVWVIVGAWAAVVLGVMGSFAGSGLAVRRIVRRARRLDDPSWVTPLLEVADRMGLDATPRLLVSGHTKMPFACGVFAPTIVLPDEAEGWALDRRHAVLLHELAHVRRKDLMGHLLGRLVCAVYWFHPLVWMAAARLRSESERACDDLALSCGTRATDYAEHLLEIVTAVRRDATPVVALAMARRNEFEGRMLAILDPELRHSSPSRRQSVALIGSLAVVAGVVAMIAPVARLASAAQAPVVQAPDTLAPVRSEVLSEVLSEVRSEVRVRREVVAKKTSKAVKTLTEQVHVQAGPDDDRPALLAKVLRGDSSAALRRIAAWGLQEYAASPAAVGALVNAVQHDADATVREMAAWSLANAGDDNQDVADALGGTLRRDADERVRATSAWALGSIGAGSSIEALTTALVDASPRVRPLAAWAMGTIGSKKAPPALIGLLADRDDRTRQLAAWALYQIRDPAALPALEAALHRETDAETQTAYIRAVAEMGEPSIKVLSGLLESPDPRVKSMAVRALAGGRVSGPWPWPWPEPRPNP